MRREVIGVLAGPDYQVEAVAQDRTDDAQERYTGYRLRRDINALLEGRYQSIETLLTLDLDGTVRPVVRDSQESCRTRFDDVDEGQSRLISLCDVDCQLKDMRAGLPEIDDAQDTVESCHDMNSSGVSLAATEMLRLNSIARELQDRLLGDDDLARR